MATPNRWTIRETPYVTFSSLTSPYNALVTLRTLKTAEVDTSSETVYAQGGRGNAKLIGFSSGKTVKITLQDAIFDNIALATISGNTIATGVQPIDLIYEATISNLVTTLTLPKKIKSITSVYLLDTDGVTPKTLLAADAAASAGTKYSIAGQILTFAEASAMVARVYYKADSDATTKKISVTSSSFGGTFKLTMDCLVRDEFTKTDYAGQIIVPNAKIEDNWKISMNASGDPSMLDIPIEALKSPLNTDMWYLLVYDEGLIPAS